MISDFTQQLGIVYPIMLAPMLGVVSPEMVAAISNQGGLGSLPVGGLSPEKTRSLIRETKKLTDHPFAVNLFVHNIPSVDKPIAENMQDCKPNELYKQMPEATPRVLNIQLKQLLEHELIPKQEYVSLFRFLITF